MCATRRRPRRTGRGDGGRMKQWNTLFAVGCLSSRFYDWRLFSLSTSDFSSSPVPVGWKLLVNWMPKPVICSIAASFRFQVQNLKHILKMTLQPYVMTQTHLDWGALFSCPRLLNMRHFLSEIVKSSENARENIIDIFSSSFIHLIML